MMYVQCTLQKENKIDTSWVEEKFAVVGKKVRVKNESEVWEDGWIVTETYGKITAEQAKQMKDLYKHHRKGTDI